jgi:hypothetical protein
MEPLPPQLTMFRCPVAQDEHYESRARPEAAAAVLLLRKATSKLLAKNRTVISHKTNK